jgi:hypothetical protein
MSLVDQAAIANTLATICEYQITNQINRSSVGLQLLRVGPGQGKNVQWSARFGTDVSGARADGADLVAGDFKNDAKVPANLDYGTYDAPFSMTGKAIAAAMNASNPAELENLFADELGDAVERLAKGLNQALYTGAGGAEEIVGLYSASGPLDTTGTYAGISRATYGQWASNELANGAVDRALSFDLMRDASTAVYDASGENVDLIITGSALWAKYGKLFDSARRYTQEVTIRGQKITLQGGHKALEFDGVPVVRDVDHPAGKMSFLSTRHCKMNQMPDAISMVNQSMGMVGVQGTPEADFGQQSTGLIARINPLGRNGDSYRFQLILYPQFQLKKPNSCAALVDLDAAL